MQSPFHPFMRSKGSETDMYDVLEDVSLDGDTRLLNHTRITSILKQIDSVDGRKE